MQGRPGLDGKTEERTAPPPALFQLSRVNGEFSHTYIVHAFLGFPLLLRNRKEQKLERIQAGKCNRLHAA